MNITIHPAEDQDAFINLALNLFMKEAAEGLLKEQKPPEEHSA